MAASGWKAHQKLDCVDFFFLYIPAPFTQPRRKEEQSSKERGYCYSLCVLTLFHGFPCLPPSSKFSFLASFHFSLSLSLFIWFTESQIHLQGLSTVGQSSGADWLGGGGVWQLCPVDIPLFPLVVKTNQFLEKRIFFFFLLLFIKEISNITHDDPRRRARSTAMAAPTAALCSISAISGIPP